MWLLGLPCKTPIQSPPLRPQGHIILICLWAWFLTLDYVGGCWDVGWLCTPCKPPRKCSSEQMFIKKTKQTKTANVNCNWLRRGAGELTTYAHSQNKWSGTQQRELETLTSQSDMYWGWCWAAGWGRSFTLPSLAWTHYCWPWKLI